MNNTINQVVSSYQPLTVKSKDYSEAGDNKTNPVAKAAITTVQAVVGGTGLVSGLTGGFVLGAGVQTAANIVQGLIAGNVGIATLMGGAALTGTAAGVGFGILGAYGGWKIVNAAIDGLKWAYNRITGGRDLVNLQREKAQLSEKKTEFQNLVQGFKTYYEKCKSELLEKSEQLANREKEVNQQLEMREKDVADRENNSEKYIEERAQTRFQKYASTLEEKDKRLGKKEGDLKNYESRLAKKETDLDSLIEQRGDALYSQRKVQLEDAHKQRENQLENAYQQKEARLNVRENEQGARERELDVRQRNIDNIVAEHKKEAERELESKYYSLLENARRKESQAQQMYSDASREKDIAQSTLRDAERAKREAEDERSKFTRLNAEVSNERDRLERKSRALSEKELALERAIREYEQKTSKTFSA